MGKINGSQDHEKFRATARRRYGSRMMTSQGCLAAALSEPICDKHHGDNEERLESAWWDRMCMNTIRVLVYNRAPLEDYT